MVWPNGCNRAKPPRWLRAGAVLVVMGAALAAQQAQPNRDATPLAVEGAPRNSDAGNAERRKQIAGDSAKLLQLATELKTAVDKTDKDVLSMTVIRKADEIERLARGVKEKMKLTVGAN